VTGTIVLPEGTTLPEGATWRVRLEDAAIPGELVAEASGDAAAATGDLAFEVPYDALDIDLGRAYILHAVIEDSTGIAQHVTSMPVPVVPDAAADEGVLLTLVEAMAEAVPSPVVASPVASPIA
jgi:uncharacterized lipoprotein YbaY